MFCKQCGSQLAPGARFCTTCGNAAISETTQAFQPDHNPIPTTQTVTPDFENVNFHGFESNAPSRPTKPAARWIAISAASVVALLIGIGVVAGVEDSKYLKASNSPKLADTISSAKLDAIVQEKCTSLYDALPSASEVQALNSRAAVMNKYTTGTARKASAFLSATAWIDSTEIPDVDGAIDAVLAGGLDDVIAKTAAIRESDRAAFSALWASEFREIAISGCGMSDKLSAGLVAQQAFAGAKSSLETYAASVPWYPDGYTEWSEDSNLAWQWVNGYDCNLGDWCWHIKVITESGCPDGVYAELNELDSAGNVIDFSNDTVPSLRAGGTAIMEFSTYNESSDSGQMTTLTCHNY